MIVYQQVYNGNSVINFDPNKYAEILNFHFELHPDAKKAELLVHFRKTKRVEDIKFRKYSTFFGKEIEEKIDNSYTKKIYEPLPDVIQQFEKERSLVFLGLYSINYNNNRVNLIFGKLREQAKNEN